MTDTENDEIFISGLPLDVTEEEIATYFGQIGIIKEVGFSSNNVLDTLVDEHSNRLMLSPVLYHCFYKNSAG